MISNFRENLSPGIIEGLQSPTLRIMDSPQGFTTENQIPSPAPAFSSSGVPQSTPRVLIAWAQRNINHTAVALG